MYSSDIEKQRYEKIVRKPSRQTSLFHRGREGKANTPSRVQLNSIFIFDAHLENVPTTFPGGINLLHFAFKFTSVYSTFTI